MSPDVNTPRGAKASATIYSIVETAKENGLNPFTYLTYLFEQLPNVDIKDSRPLERVYPVVFLDAIHFKVRKENRIVNKAAYSVLGINMAGQKEVLGIWIGEHESASFWLGVCNDLKNRGVEDILIACKDNLASFSEAINTVFPRTEIQLCVIHQIRNSLKYVSYKEQKELIADLKKVYQSLTIEEAELAFANFKEKWGKKHAIIIRSWENNWLELTAFFKFYNPCLFNKSCYISD